MLRRFDADGDGQLNATERAEAEAAHQRILERFDADGDGKLNQQERRQAMRQHMLDKFDADGDGQLSEAERDQARAFAEQRRQKRQSQGAQRPASAR